MKNQLRGLLKTGMCLLICFLSLRGAAVLHAQEQVDLTRETQLTIEAPASGMEFRIYRAADMDENGVLSLTESMLAYSVSFDQNEKSSWKSFAETVSAYLERDKTEPLHTVKTEENKKTTQTLNLKPGMYLVKGADYTDENGQTREGQPSLITLPQLGENGAWVYECTIIPKYSEPSTQYRVHKSWKDSGYESKRPESIEIQLLENGTVRETVELSEKNNWSYEWKDLDTSKKWTVTEKDVSDGYTVTISREGATFLVTNTRKPTTPTTPRTPSGDGGGGGGKLPQTGMLWWPVPLLAFAGMLFLLIGTRMKNSQSAKNDN